MGAIQPREINPYTKYVAAHRRKDFTRKKCISPKAYTLLKNKIEEKNKFIELDKARI